MVSRIVTRIAGRLLSPRYIRAFQRRYYEFAQLKFRLASDVHVEVLSHVDWCIYNDIFVDGEYDKPIEAVVSLARGGQQDLKILDLGCSVGFFLLRLLDRLGVDGLRPRLQVGAVEPDCSNLREIKRRLEEQEAYQSGLFQLDLRQGLAGKRRGSAAFETTHSYHSGRVVDPSSEGSRSNVLINYVDLTESFGEGSWDLVKCDIEGSEGEFVMHYSDLLERTSILVIEFHHGACDVAVVTDQLLSYGFVDEGAIAERASNSVHWFTRILM